MKYYATLDETLDKRFDDNDEIRDISTHGIAAGFGNFIYSSELDEFHREFEQEIEDRLHDLNYSLEDIVKDSTDWSYQELRERSVWIVVEAWCHDMVDKLDEEEDNA